MYASPPQARTPIDGMVVSTGLTSRPASSTASRTSARNSHNPSPSVIQPRTARTRPTEPRKDSTARMKPISAAKVSSARTTVPAAEGGTLTAASMSTASTTKPATISARAVAERSRNADGTIPASGTVWPPIWRRVP